MSSFSEALAQGKFELRLLVSSKCAGAIIGKGGENIKRIRTQVCFRFLLVVILWLFLHWVPNSYPYSCDWEPVGLNLLIDEQNFCSVVRRHLIPWVFSSMASSLSPIRIHLNGNSQVSHYPSKSGLPYRPANGPLCPSLPEFAIPIGFLRQSFWLSWWWSRRMKLLNTNNTEGVSTLK